MNNRPFARATITARSVTLNPWRPGLVDGGPGGMLLRPLRRRGVVLADLIENRDDRELIVRFVPRDSATEPARAALVRWASQVGWERIWLDDRVNDLLDAHGAAGSAHARCPTCGLRWEDERPEFWDHVRENGWFPGSCIACGGSLPEWDVTDDRRRVPRPTTNVAAPGRLHRRVG